MKVLLNEWLRAEKLKLMLHALVLYLNSARTKASSGSRSIAWLFVQGDCIRQAHHGITVSCEGCDVVENPTHPCFMLLTRFGLETKPLSFKLCFEHQWRDDTSLLIGVSFAMYSQTET